MNTRYCPSPGCGHANQYTSNKPRFCGACGKAFDAAFATVAPLVQPVVPVVVAAPQRPQHPAARQPRQFVSLRDQRGQRRAPVQAAQNDDQDLRDSLRGDFDEAPADRDAAYAEGMEIAAQLDPNAFGIGGADQPIVFRFGDLPNLRDAATKMAAEAEGKPQKRAPRARKPKA